MLDLCLDASCHKVVPVRSGVAGGVWFVGVGVFFGFVFCLVSSSGGSSALALVKETAKIEGNSNVWYILYIREVNFYLMIL